MFNLLNFPKHFAMHLPHKASLFGLFFSIFFLAACGGNTATDEQAKDNNGGSTPTDHTEQPATEEQPTPTPQTYDSMEAFWPAFQRDITTMDIASMNPKIAFPLKGAQYLIGKPSQDAGATKADFAAEIGKIFDDEARKKILDSAYTDLEKAQFDLDKYAINGLDPNGYRLIVNYDQEEETESTLFYYFGKTPVGYKLIGIDFAG
jgi:hypothetical protein